MPLDPGVIDPGPPQGPRRGGSFLRPGWRPRDKPSRRSKSGGASLTLDGNVDEPTRGSSDVATPGNVGGYTPPPAAEPMSMGVKAAIGAAVAVGVVGVLWLMYRPKRRRRKR